MIEQISTLLDFQEADMAVDNAEKQVRACKERKTANLMKQRYELAVEERKKLIAQRNKAEEDIQAISKDVEKLVSLAEIDRAKDAPEDTEVIKKQIAEIEKLVSLLAKLEEKLNKINGDVTANEKKINEYGAIANQSKEEFNVNKAEYEKILEAAKPEIDELKKVRDQKATKVEPALLAKYNNLKKNKITPTAKLMGERCGGCNMGMAAFAISNANKQGYCECENCGRIVYVE